MHVTAEETKRELDAAVDLAQGHLDRLRRHMERTVRYHDECPDGDPRKADAERKLDDLSRRIHAAEVNAEEAVDALLDFEDAHPEVTR